MMTSSRLKISSFSIAPHLPLPRRRDIEHLAVLGDGAAGDGVAGFTELVDEVLVGEGVRFVLVGDDFEEFLLDGLPGDILAGGGLGAAAEEAFEGKDAARGL